MAMAQRVAALVAIGLTAELARLEVGAARQEPGRRVAGHVEVVVDDHELDAIAGRDDAGLVETEVAQLGEDRVLGLGLQEETLAERPVAEAFRDVETDLCEPGQVLLEVPVTGVPTRDVAAEELSRHEDRGP